MERTSNTVFMAYKHPVDSIFPFKFSNTKFLLIIDKWPAYNQKRSFYLISLMIGKTFSKALKKTT
jgi:hypothetical protein